MSTDNTNSPLSEQALVAAVQNSSDQSDDVTKGIHSHGSGDTGKHHAWLEKLVPGIEKLTVHYHGGNFVAIRDPSKPPGSVKIFESMPIYARIGMHLLFHGKEQVKLLEGGKIEKLLHEQSVKQGKIYDTPDSAHSIASFIATYKLDINELLEQDIKSYKTFNEFFYRKLKPDTRPVENSAPNAFCSAADCRLTVYSTVSDAQKFWIKGDEFTIPRLLHGKVDTGSADEFSDGASLAIFRLAPADYHRFHSPLDGTIIGEPTNIDGTYYTVNPQAVNEVDFDVFTANKRSVMYVQHAGTGKKVAFVAIGAMLVGAVNWTRKAGEEIKKGEELGYFAYGGSTVIVVFPAGLIKFDDDLVKNSENVLETLMKVGYSLGVTAS